jgi:hypothetical protein
MPVAPGAFVGAAPEVRAVAVPMRAATALPISTVMVMALALALALTLAAALVVPALRERGRAWQARREQKQQNTLEHHFFRHYIPAQDSHRRDMESSDYSSPRAESLI